MNSGVVVRMASLALYGMRYQPVPGQPNTYGWRIHVDSVEYADICLGWDGLRFTLTFACRIVCTGLCKSAKMVVWPEHNETVREDELFLFAYCNHRWHDEPYVSRSPEQYTDFVTRLNDRFKSRFGEYSTHGVRRYVQLLRSDLRYRIQPHAHKRYNHFAIEIEEYRVTHRSEFGAGAAPHRPVDLSMKGMY